MLANRHPTAYRLLAAVLVLLGCATLAAGTARAGDLIVLDGDTQPLSGSVAYDVVYIDGDLQLTGNTQIAASSIYIGPDANLDTCYVAAPTGGNDACTAGRSLTMQASGAVIVSNQINLQAASGTSGPGGSLNISGNPVAVGNINTDGSGGSTSGQVSITSGGTLATGGIDAEGASVTLTAAGEIDVSGDLQTAGTGDVSAGTPGYAPSAGPVTIDSSGGAVQLDGVLNASGDAGSAGTTGGGNGAGVNINGANVQTEAIDTNGGGSENGAPGASASVSITASGSLGVLGEINASGQNGAGGSATGGAQVTLKAAGPLTIGGDVEVGGGEGASAGQIALSGSSVATGGLDATGGNGPGAPVDGSGGAGGQVNVTAPSGASLGSVLASGGNSGGSTAPAGTGGSVAVTSNNGSIDTGAVETFGGSIGEGPGANGGPITLGAKDNLTVGGTLEANGSNAGGASSPTWTGGNGGNLTLAADTGTLALDGTATVAGGTGSNNTNSHAFAGVGGNGGQVVIVANAIGTLASLSSAGGDGGGNGDTQGQGGQGGAITAFTSSPIFDAHKLVTSDGGNGNPTGNAGAQHQDTAPSGVTVDPLSGALSFTSNSPDAQGYQVLMSAGTAAPAIVLSTASTSGLHPTAPLCQPVTFTVVALNGAVGWTSAPSPGAQYTRQPSATQTCSQAPVFTVRSVKQLTRTRLRRDGWVLSVPLKLTGIGSVQATLTRVRVASAKPHRRAGRSLVVLTIPSLQITHPGVLRMRLDLPAAARLAGTYKLVVSSTSPDGTGHGSRTARWKIAQ